MPELPEVETIVRCLRPRLVGLEIRDAAAFFRPVLRRAAPADLKSYAGRKILGIERRGKLIVITSARPSESGPCRGASLSVPAPAAGLCQDGGLALVFHLKMTGQLLFLPAAEPRDKHTRLAVSFAGSDHELRFRDVRKFGFVLALPAADVPAAPEFRVLGPEPLTLGLEDFRRAFAGRKGMIKARLLDQRLLAGIGNIYADEILFEARLHPEADVSRLGPRSWKALWSATRSVLERAIRCRGTTLRDYRDGDGERGGFQERLRVYGREGLACPRCGSKIRRLRVAGRSSHFCPRCQRV